MTETRNWEQWHKPKVIEALASSWLLPASGKARTEFYRVTQGLYKPGWSLCDFGCGPGVDTKVLVAQGWNYTGCDRTDELLSIAKQDNPELKFYKDDIFNSWQGNDSYDVVMCSDVLVHLPTTTAPLATLYRLAKRYVVIKLCYLTHMQSYQHRSEHDAIVHYFNPTSFYNQIKVELAPKRIGMMFLKVDNPMSNEQAVVVIDKCGDDA